MCGGEKSNSCHGIGFIGFQGHPKVPTKWADKRETLFGYEINEEYRNKGYATEAAKVLLDWGFNKSYQNLEVVKAHTIHGWRIVGESHNKGNPASIRVLEKLGAIYDGHHHDDKAGEVLIWKITKDNFNMLNNI